MTFPVNFSDPIWLWLALPVAAIVVVGWMAASRTLPAGRRIASLVIRLVLAACLVLSLAGMRLALPSDRLSVVFLLDASASMLDATSEELVNWARAAVREKPEEDTAGVVVFGGNALVDRLPSTLDELPEPASVPVAGATDVAAAVRLAAAIFPAGTQQRIVLLSDGNDTSGEAQDAIAAAAARGIRLDVVTPADESAAEVLVDALDAPPGARVGETIDLVVRLRSTITTDATLRLLATVGSPRTTRPTRMCSSPGPRRCSSRPMTRRAPPTSSTRSPKAAWRSRSCRPAASRRRSPGWPATTAWCSTTSRPTTSASRPWRRCSPTCVTSARAS